MSTSSLLVLVAPATPSSWLALVTTAHLALAAVRHHRPPAATRTSALPIVSLLLAGTPWLFPSVAGLVFGLGVHGLWFAICEWLAPPARPNGAPVLDGNRLGRSHDRPVAARPKGFIEVPVIAVVEEAPDIRSFRFARPAGFEFVAGQFLTVRVRTDGHDHVRCYSLSSAPEARGFLEITVKRQGLVSGVLHDTIRPGDRLFVRAPAGAFVYPAGDSRPIVLIAGGIGITPVLSMLRHAVLAEPDRAATLLYSAQQASGLAFRDELESLARRHPQVRLILSVTRGETPDGVLAGRIDGGRLRELVPDIADSISFICGPQVMIDALRVQLVELGVPASAVRAEVFEAAVAAAGGRNARTEAHASTPTQAHTIRWAPTGATVPVTAGQTLLEAAEAGGLGIDSVCRSGVCGTCRTHVIQGEVDCESTLIDESDRALGYILACVTHVHSDCTIETEIGDLT